MMTLFLIMMSCAEQPRKEFTGTEGEVKIITIPICNVESGHRACTVCLISHIAMKIPGKLEWNPKTEKFTNNEQANAMLSRPQRSPYGTNYVKF